MCGMGGFPGTPKAPNQFWRFITPIFLHTGVVHLLLNLTMQLRQGLQMERDIGSLRMGLIYLICGISGNLLGSLLAPRSCK